MILRSIKKGLLLTVGVGALMTGNASFAQDNQTVTLEAVVITAERREEDIQKTAVSVSVRTGDQLQAEGKYTLAQILQNIPGVSGGESVNTGTTAGSGGGTDNTASGVVIRGIKSNSGTGGSITSTAASAAIYVDDIYNGIGGGYDIGRVEVLRGPQGTLYGRSAVAGAVGTYTKNPELDKFGGTASVELGNNEVGAAQVRHYTGALNIPIITDKLAVRIAGNRYTSTPTYENNTGGASRQTGGKIKVLYKPTEQLSVLVGAALQENWGNSGGNTGVTITQPSLNKIVITKSAIDQTTIYPGTNSYRQVWAKLDWDLGFASLTYIPAFRNWHSDQTNNLNTSTTSTPTPFTPGPANGLGCVQNNTQLLQYQNGLQCFYQPAKTAFDEFITHEVRFASNADSKIQWQTGAAYYFNQVENHTDNEFVDANGQGTYVDSCNHPPQNYDTNPASPTYGQCIKGGNTKYIQYATTHKKTSAVGVFAEGTYPIMDTLRFTAGLRYDYTKVTVREFYYAHGNYTCLGGTDLFTNLGASNPGNPAATAGCNLSTDSGIRRYHNLTYKARLEYDLTPENLVYGSISTGSSPGDVSITVNGNYVPSVLDLKSQTLTAYEIGSKNRFLDNTLQVNGDVYYQDYGGYQRADVNIGTVEPLFTSVVTPVKFYGFEAEFLYQITPKDRAGLNIGYTHGWYANPNQVVYTTVGVGGAAGTPVTLGQYIYFQSITGIVPLTVNLTYDHDFDLEDGSALTLHGEMKYTSGYRPGDSPTQTSYFTTTKVGTTGACVANCGKTYNSGQINALYNYAPPAYLFNANATWRSKDGKYSINGYVKNIFDNRYKTGGSWSINSTTGAVTTSASVADPRSFGFVATINF
jgi:iron complex outermembrane receptor protein